jgi:acyl dehydratase
VPTPSVVCNPSELKALVGTDLGFTDWRSVGQSMITTFGEVTGDTQWIHTDVERAKSGPFGSTIAHGFLTLALMLPLTSKLLEFRDVKMGVNYGLDKVRFTSVVPVDSEVRLGAVVTAVEEVGTAMQVTLTQTLQVRGQHKPACVSVLILRVYF